MCRGINQLEGYSMICMMENSKLNLIYSVNCAIITEMNNIKLT